MVLHWSIKSAFRLRNLKVADDEFSFLLIQSYFHHKELSDKFWEHDVI